VEAATKLNNTDAVNKPFLTILSRYPSAAEMTTAMGSLAHRQRHGAQ
jgi:hypothetical protein